MTLSLHPAVAASASIALIVAYLFCGHWLSSVTDEGPFDVPTVLSGLLDAEASAKPRSDARVAIGFGGCLDRLASIDVLEELNATPPDSVSSAAELHSIVDLEKTFAYYFQNGASASRSTKNTSFFHEVEHAFISASSARASIGGNAPVMARRFASEGISNVVLGTHLPTSLHHWLHASVAVVGDEVSEDEQDTHLILEYEKDDIWGQYSAPRANRFNVYRSLSSSNGLHLMSLIEQFTREVMRSPPDLLVIGGLRQLLSTDISQGTAPSPLKKVSQLIAAARSSTRIHVELSSFADPTDLVQTIEHIVQHADSIGLNEQELPALRRQLANWHTSGDSHSASKPVAPASEDSTPSLASVLDDARAVFRLLGHIAGPNQRRFSRLHLHTLAFQVIVTEANSKLWPNSGAAVAKASLTAHRYTCGTKNIDVERAKLLMRSSARISMEAGTTASEHQLHFSGRNPVVCWREAEPKSGKVDIEICVAPVLVCTHVQQTVGGGDNISAAGLVLQL